MTIDTDIRYDSWLSWVSMAAGGAVWGTGAARTLAQELRIAFCYGLSGTVLIALLGAVAAVAAGWLLGRRGDGVPSPAAAFLPLFLPLLDVLSGTHQPWRGPVLLAGSIIAVLLFAVRLDPLRWLVLTVALPLMVYLPDLSPYVGRADTFEFQVIGPQLGIAHPSGYPLYTLICKLFSWLPFGSVAWRINLSSAVFAALAAGCLFLALVSDLDDGAAERASPVAFLAAMILAFSPTLWSRSIEAEVYALNGCLVALALLLAVRWHGGRLQPRRAWPALGLLIGVAISSHITLGALAALAATGLLVKPLRPRARTWGLALVLGLLGLSLYAYIPLRWPAVTGGEWMSPQAFFRFVTNADSGGALRPLAFYQDPARWGLVGRLFVAQVGWGGLFLAVVGLVALARRRPALAMGTVLAFGAWVWFNLGFYVADPDYSAFLIPAHVVLVYWLGSGARAMASAAATRYQLLRPAYLTLLAALALSRVWQTGPALDTRSPGRADEAWARYVLAQPLVEDAAILADSEKFPPLFYLQQVEGLRPDLDLVTLFSEAQYRADLEVRVSAGQTVYLARYLPGMDAFGVSSQGPLVAVASPEPASRPLDAAASTGVDFGGLMTLVAHELVPDPEDRPLHHLTLTWQARTTGMDDLEVRLRLLSLADGSVVWELAGARPVGGYSTTQAWPVGRQVDDYYALAWPAWLPGGTYQLEIALFPRFGEQGLPVAGDDGMWHSLDQVAVRAQPVPATTQRLAVLFDAQVWLVGQSLAQEVPAGGTLALDLAWLCRASSSGSPILSDAGDSGSGSVPRVRWVPLEGGEPLTQPLYALGESQLSELCLSGTTTPSLRRYGISVPAEPGNYRLDVFWPLGETAPAGRPVQCRWLGAPAEACALSEVRVVAANTGLASFDGGILLQDAAVDAGDVPAGGRLVVDLRWRALQTLDRDYTAFVQVVGPDGRLYGQVDSWPVQGARPTSGWRAGEEIDDPYRFYVAPNGPAGDYRVIVGWYLLADMSRLPVVDAAGREVGDFYEIGIFSLP